MRYALGIDLGGTNIAAGMVDENYNVIARASVKTRAPRPAADIVADMASLARRLSEESGVTPSVVGIGSPGIVVDNIVRAASNLSFSNVPLAEMMEKELSIPCSIGNDANAAALGENVAGAGKGADSLVMVMLGTGVGGGIIDHGIIFDGFNGTGSEIGHITLVPDGRPCTCGKRGCLEAYCSATALIVDTREAMDAHPSSVMWKLCGGDKANANGKTAFDAMRLGDAAGCEVVDRYIRWLGIGISSIVTLLQPEVLAIGGGIAREGETLIAPLRGIVYPNAYYDSFTPRTRIAIASLGDDAGVVGAAEIGFQRLRAEV